MKSVFGTLFLAIFTLAVGCLPCSEDDPFCASDNCAYDGGVFEIDERVGELSDACSDCRCIDSDTGVRIACDAVPCPEDAVGAEPE